jgi:allantoinase
LPVSRQSGSGAFPAITQRHNERQLSGIGSASAFDWLSREASEYGGRMLPMQLTPYILGLPYRISSFEALLADIASRKEAWVTTGSKIVDCWAAQQQD